MNSTSASPAKDHPRRDTLSWPEGKQAALTLSFDDGFLETIQASLPILQERGIQATYNIITASAGAPFEGLPTAGWDALQKVNQLGHELACHSDLHLAMAGRIFELKKLLAGLVHSPQPIFFLRQILRTARAMARQPKYPQLQAVQKKNDLLTSRLEMEQRLPGLRVQSFVFPGGRYNWASLREVAAAGFFSARSAMPGINQAATPPLELRSAMWSPDTRCSEMTPWLDFTLRRGGWLVVVFHYLSAQNPGAYPFFCSLPDFQRFLDQATKYRLWIAPQAEVARYIYTPKQT